MRCAESQESIKVFNWNIFSKFRLNLIQILIIKILWLSFLILKGNIKKKRERGKKKIRVPVSLHYVTKSKKSYCWLLCDIQFPTGYCDERITISD